jgi:arabinogalactan oligomer/maltooligosaccharide transport system substrate-binding protein
MLTRFCGALVLSVCVLGAGCSEPKKSDTRRLRFWHTFNSNESALLDEWLMRPGQVEVATTILPFARATIRFRSAIGDGQCPDLLRIDATRIPGLVESKTIQEVPDAIWAGRSWLPEAESMASFDGKRYALPQSLDGLALIRRRGSPGAWPPLSLETWLQTAQNAARQPSLGILLDGYWFVAFLRSAGASLPDDQGLPAADSLAAQEALTNFATLFRSGLAMDLLDERAPSRAMVKAFRRGELAQVLTGPWDLADLADGKLEDLEVAAFPGNAAPRGGQVLVVPECASDAAGAWALASALTEPQLQSQWAQRLSSIPVTKTGLKNAGRLVNEFYEALRHARPLPRHTRVPELFDDLTPAVVAVVSGDASAAEALAGVARSWNRLYGVEGSPDEP